MTYQQAASLSLKDNTWGGQDGRRIDGRGVQMHQETFQMQRLSQRTSWVLAGVPDNWKGKYRSAKLGGMKEGREKEKAREWDLTCTHGLRELKWELDSLIRGNQLGQKESMWDCQRVRQLICVDLNEVRTTQTIHATALCTLDRDPSAWELGQLGAGTRRLGRKIRKRN